MCIRDRPSSSLCTITIARIIDITKSFRSKALPQPLACQIAASDAPSLPDSLSFLFLDKLGNVVLILELSNFTPSLLQLLHALSLLFLQLHRLLLYCFTLRLKLFDLSIL